MNNRPTPETDSHYSYVNEHKQAQDKVSSSVLYKKFIDGTPLENDIAVWIAEAACKHSAFARTLERQRDALLDALEKQACATAYYNGHSNGYKPHPNGGLFWENYLCKEAVAAIAAVKGGKL